MKNFLFAAVAAVTLLGIAGCTSVESTQKFNAVKLAGPGEVARCQSHVVIPGFYIFGLPLFVGSAHGDGKMTACQQTLTAENAMFLLTKEVKSKGANRLTNVAVHETASYILPFLCYRTMQASGTGIAPAGASTMNGGF